MISDDMALTWHKAISRRHSTRNYDGMPVPESTLSDLAPLLPGFGPLCRGARAALITENTPGVFTGLFSSFVKITAPPVALAFIADTSHPHYQVGTGYLGEGIILQATVLGLDTCWVSGSFKPSEAERRLALAASERVMAVTPLGFALSGESLGARGIGSATSARKRKPLSSIVSGLPPEDWPSGCSEALEAARLAPSALNRQPWAFNISRDRISLSSSKLDLFPAAPVKLDCGIAMLHFEVGAKVNGLHGHWRMLDGAPYVAEFIFADAGL